MFDAYILAENIKKYRKSNGMTQCELAEKLLISPQSVSKWECGKSVPDIENLCAISNILHISVEQLLGVSNNERYMIGVDGGGTKTEFVLFNQEGKVLSRTQKNGCNPNICGRDRSIEILVSGIESFVKEYPNIIGLYIGSAGFATGDNAATIKKSLMQLYPRIKIECNTDIVNVISSATSQDRCIAAICGTGTVVYANEEWNLHRVGGWGYLIDSGGSGFDIGKDALSTALAECDGIGESSIITTLVHKKIGCKVWEHLKEIYEGGNPYIASFAPIVSKAYSMGDKVAEKILVKNATRLSEFINFAAKKWDCGDILVMAGNVVAKDDEYRKMIKDRIDTNLKMIIPDMPPVYGACVQCCKMCGIKESEIKENFVKTYCNKEEKKRNEKGNP